MIFFSQHIRDNVYAKKAECVEFLDRNKHIVNAGRDWRNIKDYVRNFCEKKARSIIQGIYPDDWKIAKVVPVFKNGARNVQYQ
jgi:hypothetical protein